MNEFRIQAEYGHTGDRYQTLLGVTGSGKTFTMANVIERVQKPALVIREARLWGVIRYRVRDSVAGDAIPRRRVGVR